MQPFDPSKSSPRIPSPAPRREEQVSKSQESFRSPTPSRSVITNVKHLGSQAPNKPPKGQTYRDLAAETYLHIQGLRNTNLDMELEQEPAIPEQTTIDQRKIELLNKKVISLETKVEETKKESKAEAQALIEEERKESKTNIKIATEHAMAKGFQEGKKTALANVQPQLDEAKAELDKNSAKIKHYNKELIETTNQITNLKTELEETKTHTEQERAKRMESEGKLSQLQEKQEKLKDRLSQLQEMQEIEAKEILQKGREQGIIEGRFQGADVGIKIGQELGRRETLKQVGEAIPDIQAASHRAGVKQAAEQMGQQIAQDLPIIQDTARREGETLGRKRAAGDVERATKRRRTAATGGGGVFGGIVGTVVGGPLVQTAIAYLSPNASSLTFNAMAASPWLMGVFGAGVAAYAGRQLYQWSVKDLTHQ